MIGGGKMSKTEGRIFTTFLVALLVALTILGIQDFVQLSNTRYHRAECREHPTPSMKPMHVTCDMADFVEMEYMGPIARNGYVESEEAFDTRKRRLLYHIREKVDKLPSEERTEFIENFVEHYLTQTDS